MISPPKSADARCADNADALIFILAYATLFGGACQADVNERPWWEYACPLTPRFEDRLVQWMMFQGHIRHYRPYPSPAPTPVNSLHFDGQSCFAFTELGRAFGCWLLDGLNSKDADEKRAAREAIWLGTLSPHFAKRQLTWGQHVVKSFRQPAQNQELVLCAAEELAWLEWFDDPLPRTDINPKRV